MRLFFIYVVVFLSLSTESKTETGFFIHRDIVVTIFWIGEDESADNNFIQNRRSAWDDDWVKNFGGIDDPNQREGYLPKNFLPKENPFYFALPFNDFQKGKRKKIAKKIPWANSKSWQKDESMCKNRWIKITKNNKVAYAQWQDVGPFLHNDFDYVFANNKPGNKIKSKAGLDVSPAVATYLELEDVDLVDWQFVDESQVPDGPWKKIITKSNINWR